MNVGPFGSMKASTLVIPWTTLAIVIVGLPLVVGGVTALAVRSGSHRAAAPYRMTGETEISVPAPTAGSG